MDLLKYELKKIWNPPLVLIILLLGSLYFFLFCSFYTQYFNNGGAAEAAFETAAGWAEKYGSTMEPAERAELDGQLDAEYARFASFVKSYARAGEYGIVDWDSFADFQQTYYEGASERGSAADMEKESVIWRIVMNSNYYTIVFLQGTMERYDYLENGVPPDLNYDGGGAMRSKKLARISEIESSDMVHGYLPANIQDNTWEYAKYLTAWCVLSVILLLSPTLVRDRLRHTRSMQWSSRRGRRIWNTQLLAAELSAAVLALMDILAYALPFLAQHPLIFKDFRLFTFASFSHPWVNWTYGQYLVVIAVMIFLLTVAAAGITAVLSQYSGHYIAMLLKALPLFAVMAYVGAGVVMNRPFFFGNPLSEWLELPAAELPGVAVLLLLSAVLLLIARARQTKRELL